MDNAARRFSTNLESNIKYHCALNEPQTANICILMLDFFLYQMTNTTVYCSLFGFVTFHIMFVLLQDCS